MERYDISGMSCAACSARVEKAVSKVEGVKKCSVNLLTNSMIVEGSADSQTIISAVVAAGYGAKVQGSQNASNNAVPEEKTEFKTLRNRLIASLVFLVPLMYISMGYTMWGWPLPNFLIGNFVGIGIIQLILTAIIAVINQKFFISGFKGLIKRSPNMDTLVSLGATAAACYSFYALFAMTVQPPEHASHYLHEFYFESAGMILTLITLGKMLEALSKGRTTSALKGLMELKPKTARILEGETEITVPIEQLKIGDIFIVRPGDSIPTDGIVLEGNGAVDESALTGESIPVDKFAGHRVSAATINQSGYLKCRAERVGEDTTLSQIIQMVSDASATKAPIAKAADKISGIFVPTVIAIAVVTIAVWLILGNTIGFALARGISVLVISCPCALGLATPVAIMVGSGMGAKNGILFKTAASLEATGKIKTVLFDKTGTLTEGKPHVTDIVAAPGVSEQELLAAAYSLELKSEHPLARAVVNKAEELGINAYNTDDFKVLPGNGLTAKMGGEELYGGSVKFIGSVCGVPKNILQKAENFSMQGKTPLAFSKRGSLLGVIAVADIIKPQSIKAVKQLKNMGIRVAMITGDNEKTAAAIGKKLGITEISAGVLPGGKEEAVKKYSENGMVAMVGDGINDAPALTRADVGIAISAGADIAMDSADVVLMKSSPLDVCRAIRLGRATLRNIHQNLFWAFFYNCIGIPLAAGVFISIFGWQLNPMFGAAAMSLSSFFVVTNALRLNFTRLGDKNDKNTENVAQEAPKEEKNMKITIKIEGMMCPHCEAHVKNALEALAEVESAEVSHTAGEAVVTLKSDVDNGVLKSAVEAEGYKVTAI